MTDENNGVKFKAPSMPEHQSSNFVKPATATVQATGASAPAEKTVTKVNYDNNFAADFNLPPKVLQTKFIAAIAAGILFIGMLFGCVMAPSEKVRQVGMDGVVSNPYFQEHPVYRCGMVEADKACVLYIMNAKGYDQLGRDFFVQAANITGVPEYTIRINNVTYAEKLIRPGYIAQIYIPSRR